MKLFNGVITHMSKTVFPHGSLSNRKITLRLSFNIYRQREIQIKIDYMPIHLKRPHLNYENV